MISGTGEGLPEIDLSTDRKLNQSWQKIGRKQNRIDKTNKQRNERTEKKRKKKKKKKTGKEESNVISTTRRAVSSTVSFQLRPSGVIVIIFFKSFQKLPS